VALSPVLLEYRAGRSGDPGDGELHAVGWIAEMVLGNAT
jgi:hypothetical protein